MNFERARNSPSQGDDSFTNSTTLSRNGNFLNKQTLQSHWYHGDPTGREILLLQIGAWTERNSKTNFIRISYEDVKFLSAPAQKLKIQCFILLFTFRLQERGNYIDQVHNWSLLKRASLSRSVLRAVDLCLAN